MRTLILFIALLTACTDTRPPRTPPPPTPPDRPANAVLVNGRVVDSIGMIVDEATVTVRAANERCVATTAEAGARTDANGTYSVLITGETGPAYEGCVIVEASAGGATGRATSAAEFTSAEPRTVQVEVRLARAPALDREMAGKIMAAMRKAIGENDQDAIAFLLPYINGGPEAFRAGLEDMRIVLGQPTRFQLSNEAVGRQQPRFTAALFGTTGNSLTFSMNDDERVRVHNPVIWYALRGRAWAREFVSRVSAGDPERLARLMTADDLEYPVDRARRLMESFRSRIDLTRGRSEFVGIDEKRNVFRYRLIGERNGKPAEEIIELVYGDGLLGLRE